MLTKYFCIVIDMQVRHVLLDDLKSSATTASQKTSIQRRRTTLLKRIQKLDTIRNTYMPGLGTHLARLSRTTEEVATSTPERIPLHLPSSLPPDHRASICMADIPAIEDQIRFAQASEALTTLRCQLTKRTYANRYKSQNVSSQRYYTRFQTLQEHVESKIKVACRRYRMARAALLSLRGPGKWEDTLQELRPNDVRGISEKALADEEQEETRKARRMAGLDDEHIAEEDFVNVPITTFNPHLAIGEGYRTLSWVWYSTMGKELGDGKSTIACASHYKF
jgi:hypothetical protein